MESVYGNNNKIWIISVSSCCFLLLMIVIYKKYISVLNINNSSFENSEEPDAIPHILNIIEEFRNQNSNDDDVDSTSSTIKV